MTAPTQSPQRMPQLNNALGTYRTLRLGMVMLVLMLGVGILLDAGRHDWCFQTSISAYYFTAIHAVLLGMVCALGACLIAYKGNSDTEDVLLDTAGFLALIVAFVPTARPGEPGSACEPYGFEAGLSDAAIRTSIAALFIVTVVALIGQIVVGRLTRTVEPWTPLGNVARVIGGVIAITVFVMYFFPDFFARYAHGIAAVTMFVLIGVVVACNAYLAAKQYGTWRNKYSIIYGVIAIAMILTAALVVVLHLWARWPYAILFVEAALLFEFALFWIVQTVELWNIDDRRCMIPPSQSVAPL
ncbi:hypothetical protein [Gordonia rhizosphera]|uniref:DUF998 domain-containing protein n=1 Tax=Gordonia rhizosphera NBRC 16068 TaxID=1108045 RepID=K6WQT7_9ACTN|nr:hypothetical protein [Gordonia rhizosphera]GAB88899.1 hypothetical protein GORHZ_046_00490 [Gordonia rhizosphera NBRC 16068]